LLSQRRLVPGSRESIELDPACSLNPIALITKLQANGKMDRTDCSELRFYN